MKVGKILGLVAMGLFVLLAPAAICETPEPTPDAGACYDFQPAGTVALNFTIDATARPDIYNDEDFEWKGSFSYNKDTRILTYDVGWAGGTGPYAGLWDDGQWIDCGHEPTGALAGDNKFGIAAFMTIPTTDTTIEYGAQTKRGGWMWVGGNGSVVVPANSSTPVTADGMTLPAPGNTDMKLTLDTGNLGSSFVYTAGQPVVVKGTYSWWETDPAYDDGTHGDATADDGIFTYTLGLNDVTRAKPASGTNQEFVWVINNVEYKTTGGTAAEQTGVAAQINSGSGWTDATITLAGNGNTQIAIP